MAPLAVTSKKRPVGPEQMNVLPFASRWAPDMNVAAKDFLFGAV
jgi:hypothetical protein